MGARVLIIGIWYQVRASGELLGHAHPRTTERYYNQATGISAGRKLADALAHLTQVHK